MALRFHCSPLALLITRRGGTGSLEAWTSFALAGPEETCHWTIPDPSLKGLCHKRQRQQQEQHDGHSHFPDAVDRRWLRIAEVGLDKNEGYQHTQHINL